MKAWDDLNRDVSLYWTGDEQEPRSYWYLDHGCKIEKFVDDGRVEINNVMMAGDHYCKITSEQYEVFMDRGWLAGCYRVCMETYSDRIIRARKLLNSSYDQEEVSNRLEILRKKLSRYVELNNKL
jgi:hypothetical protein